MLPTHRSPTDPASTTGEKIDLTREAKMKNE